MSLKKNRAFDAVVFDMDGVILDTEVLVQKCWGAVAQRHGIPDIIEACCECLGLNQEATIKKFLERYGENFPYAEYKEEMRELFIRETIPVKKGAEEILRALKAANVKVALASSTRRAVVEKELEDAGLLKYFDYVVCGDMVTHSKPDPEIFLLACEGLGVAPENAYAVEDSYNGIRSAYAGKLRPVMVPDMVAPNAEMLELTEAVFSSLLELKEYLLIQ